MPEGKPFTVAVVGNGLVGAAFAQALRHRNINVNIYEKNPKNMEVGASLGLGNNAIKALRLCGPDTYNAAMNLMKEPANGVAFAFKDGYNQPPHASWSQLWGSDTGEGGAGVHRSQFLTELTKTLPEGLVQFSKNVQDIQEPENGKDLLKILFTDGTTAEADIVVGCDGVGSHVRRHLLGEGHPSARPKYAHRYCYRALTSAEKGREALGEEMVKSVGMWLSRDSSCVTVPIANNTLLSVTAMREDPNEWPEAHHTILPSSREEMIADLTSWGPDMQAAFRSVDDHIDRWAFFDFAENPVPFYARGRIALAGDAAHATTPHLGSGAGFGFEDAAVLAEVLADEHFHGRPEEIEAALQAYNEIRHPRGSWLPKASRRNGSLLSMNDPEAGDDFEKIKKESLALFHTSWNGDVEEYAKQAKENFAQRLSKA